MIHAYYYKSTWNPHSTQQCQPQRRRWRPPRIDAFLLFLVSIEFLFHTTHNNNHIYGWTITTTTASHHGRNTRSATLLHDKTIGSTVENENDTKTMPHIPNYHHHHHRQRQTWMFRRVYPIAYDRYYCESTTHDHEHNDDAAVTKIFVLNGFGMGTFHQHDLMKELMIRHNNDDTTTTTATLDVYAMDYLGQGASWPASCDDGRSVTEQGLQYSAATWMEQIIQFIEQVILQDATTTTTTTTSSKKTRVHLVGNSLGGYLATYVAATRPDLVASLVLLNATPIWGLNLPGWTGHLPAPTVPKLVGRVLFDLMRSTSTIQQFLNVTYVNDPTVYHPTLVQDIQSCTNGPGGHAAFASILWSPPLSVPTILDHSNGSTSITSTTTTTTNFYDCLAQVSCPVLLCYGQDDPWCKPVFAKQMLQRLQQRHASSWSAYVELSNVGHCPNHEAPVATATVIHKWLPHVMNLDVNDPHHAHPAGLLLDGLPLTVEETWGQTTVQERNVDDIQCDWTDQIAVALL